MFSFLIILLFLQIEHYSCDKNNTFSLKYEWRDVNYTWPSSEKYQNAIKTKKFIPGNSEIEGFKIYKDFMYFALPLHKLGIPATLTRAKKIGWDIGIIEPFPNWDENVDPKNCSTFQSVQGFEVDNQGILWVIDGERKNNQTDCPCKLVLLDLNQEGKRVFVHIFPNKICLQNGGFLNDIVIDETDGTYAYMTDASVIDPGLIIFSKKTNSSWKIRDKSMFADIDAADYLEDGKIIRALDPVDGIALSPKISSRSPEKLKTKQRVSRKKHLSRSENNHQVAFDESNEKMVYYSPLTSLNLYRISTNILKNEEILMKDQWRRNITTVGKKQSQGDGMVFNEKGELFYSLVPKKAVGLWDSSKPFNTSKILDQNTTLIVNPNSFAFDGTQLYLLGRRRILTMNTTCGSYLKN